MPKNIFSIFVPDYENFFILFLFYQTHALINKASVYREKPRSFHIGAVKRYFIYKYDSIQLNIWEYFEYSNF